MLGKSTLVNYLCFLMLHKLKNKGTIGRSFSIPLHEIVNLFNSSEYDY